MCKNIVHAQTGMHQSEGCIRSVDRMSKFLNCAGCPYFIIGVAIL